MQRKHGGVVDHVGVDLAGHDQGQRQIPALGAKAQGRRADHGDVRVRRHLIAADLGVAAAIDEIDVEKAVGGKVQVEGKAEKDALAVGQDLTRDVEKWRRQNLTGIKVDDLDPPAPLDDEQPTGIVRRSAGEHRLGEKGCNPGGHDHAR